MFSEDLKLFKTQEEVNNNLFRLDMICAIKDTQSPFWKRIKKYYKSEYIVFEFKNYQNGVDQNLIYITEKYEEEQSTLTERVKVLREKLSRAKENSDNIVKLVRLVKKYTEITELTPEIVRELRIRGGLD